MGGGGASSIVQALYSGDNLRRGGSTPSEISAIFPLKVPFRAQEGR